ncbi:MAG: hypothetical protein O7A62_03500, partial [Alphaproteobacteria bacterium]|nr:hypothetical protein [Alphaproteobacteria bacterium]
TLWCKKQAPLNNPADQPTTPLIQRPYYIKNFFIYKSLLGYWPSIPNRFPHNADPAGYSKYH